MNCYLELLLGVACAGLGGDLFIRGTVGLARWLRVSPGVIGVTVAAFATSSPELSVAINSALEAESEIALGNALGANVVNIGLILGIALVIGAIRSSRAEARSNYRSALAAPIVIAVLALDGRLSRVDGLIMIAAFVGWLVSVTIVAHRQRRDSLESGEKPRYWMSVVYCLVGFVLLVLAGDLFVSGGCGVAAALGLDGFAVGAVIVALGTTVPELASVLMSRIRGHDEIGLGTLLGSNIFNGLLVVGVAATIRPIEFDRVEVLAVLAFGIATVALTLPSARGVIDRWRGGVLLLLYAAFALSAIS